MKSSAQKKQANMKSNTQKKQAKSKILEKIKKEVKESPKAKWSDFSNHDKR